MPRLAGPVLTICWMYLIPLTALSAAEPDTPANPPPTDREVKILAALDAPTAIDFADQPLSDVMDFLTQKHEIPIQLDNRALTDAGVGSDTPVTRTLRGISLRSLLRLILGELDLTYQVGDGYLLITSKTEAENMLRFRVYPVADLVTTDSEFRPALQADAKPDADFENLIDVLALCVAPTTWNSVGGPAALQENRNAQTLSVLQTDEAQEGVAQLLAALRRVREKQLTAAMPVDPFDKRQPPREQSKGAFALRVHRLSATTHRTMATKPAAQAQQAPKSTAAKDAAAPNPSATPPEPSDGKLESVARELADVVPELFEPESWQPAGPGKIRAVGSTLLVWHNDEAQYRIARLIEEILPGGASQPGPVYYPAVRLMPPAIRVAWPQEEELGALERNVAIQQALEEPTAIHFAEQPLSDVIDFLKQKHEIEIQLDNRALTDAGVGSDTPITRTVDGLPLRTVLKLLLGELDLTYVVRNEVLLITSKTDAESMLVAKIYPVFDLVVRPLGASPQIPGLDFAALIENITDQIAPTTWKQSGGPGQAKEFVNSGALVISQTAAVHEEIAAYLRALRQSAAAQN